jgi:hypothetical protein
VPGADKMAGRIVFTMGCHGGQNVADNLPGDPARLEDWAQRYLRSKTAVYIGNTGFGYGDTVTVALTERLLGIFAKKINSANTTIGEQWVEALTSYYLSAGDYDVFDEKAMIEATFYGLPFYRFTSPGSTTTPPPPSTTPDSGIDVASLAPIAPAPVQQTLPSGQRWWEIAGQTLNVPYRPVQPLYTKEVTVPGKSARGVFIRSLQTHDVLNVKPLIAYPRVDSQLREPDPDFRGTFWPANVVSLLRTKSLGQERASVVVKAGQFRPNTVGNPSLGTERIVDSIGVDVAYSSAADVTAPEVLQVGGVIHDGRTTFFVRASDASGIKKVAVLYNDGTQAAWTFLLLDHVSGNLYTKDVIGLETPTHIIGEAMDIHGNTGYGANKGENHTSFTDPPTAGPSILIEVPRPGAIFTLNQAVTPDFACSDTAGVATCTGAVITAGKLDTSTPGTRTFTVTATDLAGNTTSRSVTYVVRFTFAGFKQPVDNPPTLNVVKLGSTIPLKWSLLDAAGRFISDLNAVTSVTSEAIPCPSGATDVVEETTTAPLVALKYDAANNQYVFSWQTQKAWGAGCRRVYVALADGPARFFADFRLK